MALTGFKFVYSTFESFFCSFSEIASMGRADCLPGSSQQRCLAVVPDDDALCYHALMQSALTPAGSAK